MKGRTKVWLAVAVVFVAVNLIGTGMAASARELPHAALHVLLAAVGVYFVARLSRRAAADVPDALAAEPAEIADRLKNLEQSVDAVAIEIERIGEGQRFMTRVMSERGTQPSSDEHDTPQS